MVIAFIGTSELLLIGGLALLLVGGKKLPEMMRGLGKGIKEFKAGMNDSGQSDVLSDSEPQTPREKSDIRVSEPEHDEEPGKEE